jgi:toxin ParE1/3/4
MSRLLRVTKPAQQDLEDIWLNLEAVGGIEVADRRLAAIQKKFLQLKQFPGVGRSREDLAPGLRSCVVNDVVSIVGRVAADCAGCAGSSRFEASL